MAMGTIQFNLGNWNGDLTLTVNAKQSGLFKAPSFPHCTDTHTNN